MKQLIPLSGFVFFTSLLFIGCNSGPAPEEINQHILTNQTLLAKKKTELGDLNYKVTNNSLHVGTNQYDSTIGKDFNTLSGAMQTSIDSLQAQTDSLKELVKK